MLCSKNFFFIQGTIIIIIIMTTTEEEMNIWKKNSVPFILLFYSIILRFSFSNRMIFQEFLFVYCFFFGSFFLISFFFSLSLIGHIVWHRPNRYFHIDYTFDWLIVCCSINMIIICTEISREIYFFQKLLVS